MDEESHAIDAASFLPHRHRRETSPNMASLISYYMMYYIIYE